MTTFWATNDPREAFAVGDRVAVVDRGRIRQIATPEDLYQKPVDRFVAEFVAAPDVSMIPGRVTGPSVDVVGGSLVLNASVPDQDVEVGVLAHHWEIVEVAGIPVTVESREFLGDRFAVEVRLGSRNVRVRIEENPPDVGEEIQIYTHRFTLFDRSGRRLTTVG